MKDIIKSILDLVRLVVKLTEIQNKFNQILK